MRVLILIAMIVLAGCASGARSDGPIVCSCHQVGQRSIIAATESPAIFNILSQDEAQSTFLYQARDKVFSSLCSN